MSVSKTREAAEELGVAGSCSNYIDRTSDLLTIHHISLSI